jgi:hypothetical protein
MSHDALGGTDQIRPSRLTNSERDDDGDGGFSPLGDEGFDQGQTFSIEMGPGYSQTIRKQPPVEAIRSNLWETEVRPFDLLVSKHVQSVEKLEIVVQQR